MTATGFATLERTAFEPRLALPPALRARVREVDAGEVYQKLGRPVLGYIRGQGVADAEDVLGEVFFQVTRSLPGFKGDDDALRRWVFTIARNRVIDDRRRRSRHVRSVELDQDEVTAVAAEVPPLDPDLERGLAELTEEQREVVALRFIADLPLTDVAALTGRSIGAVKAMQHRALERLARQLGSSDGEATDG
jgi:RNA polymerase sigma factor (sigma-70 family)